MIRGSGNISFTLVTIDSRNASCGVWWSESDQRWCWELVWEDGTPYGTHWHTGNSPSKTEARSDIVKLILWIEDKWPSWEYFEFP